MPRTVNVAAAQMGPVQRSQSRADAVERLLVLLREAHGRGAELVVFPELALTTFFPRYASTDQAEIDTWFETEMPSAVTKPLFEEAARLGVGFCLGYGELTADGHHYNTQLMVERDGCFVGRYRKVHLPGHAEVEGYRAFQHLEKYYFEVGPQGFQTWRAFGGVVGMLICNDRRWPEAYRVLGLKGAELIAIGYNTPIHNPPAPEHDRFGDFHNQLVMSAGAYQNGTWVVGVAKAGEEEGVPMIGGSCIIHPSGMVVAQCAGVGDEVVVAACDLDECTSYKRSVFNFALHRRIEHYGLIASQTEAIPPA